MYSLTLFMSLLLADSHDQFLTQTVFLLLDDKRESQGVESQISRQAMTPPYDASQVAGYPVRILKVQGFDKRAPGWRIGYGGPWTPIIHWCLCCDVYGTELTYYVQLHREKTSPAFTVSYRFDQWGGWWTTRTERKRNWPTPPTRKLMIREYVSPLAIGLSLVP